MKTGLKKIAFPALIVFLVVSCVTINIYFPEAAVEKAADEIVDEIWGDEGEKGVEKQGLEGVHTEKSRFDKTIPRQR